MHLRLLSVYSIVCVAYVSHYIQYVCQILIMQLLMELPKRLNFLQDE